MTACPSGVQYAPLIEKTRAQIEQHYDRTARRSAVPSANVILDDADFERAVADGVGKCYLNSGQTCSALTRMLVPRSRLAEVEAIAAKTAEEQYTPGDPFDAASRLGPLVSAAQRDRVRGFIQKGIDEGAKLVTGGVEPPEGLDKGFFVRPTVFSEVRPGMTIEQEEIFGPVLSIIPYDTEEEAIAIANDTIYGLAGGVWSGDPEHAKAVARQLRTGQVEVNGGSFNPLAPFGGYKQSGNGREYGKFGLDEFLEVKAMQLARTTSPRTGSRCNRRPTTATQPWRWQECDRRHARGEGGYPGPTNDRDRWGLCMRKSTLRLYLPFLALIAAQALLITFLPSTGAKKADQLAATGLSGTQAAAGDEAAAAADTGVVDNSTASGAVGSATGTASGTATKTSTNVAAAGEKAGSTAHCAGNKQIKILSNANPPCVPSSPVTTAGPPRWA